ncbi:unnamed protein product [Closterium sp. NIES-53]
MGGSSAVAAAAARRSLHGCKGSPSSPRSRVWTSHKVLPRVPCLPPCAAMTRRDMRSEPAVKYPPRLHRYLLSSLKNRAVTLALHAVVPFSSFSTIPLSLRLSLSTVHILPNSPLPPVAPLAAFAAAWGVAFLDPSDPMDCGISLNITCDATGMVDWMCALCPLPAALPSLTPAPLTLHAPTHCNDTWPSSV